MAKINLTDNLNKVVNIAPKPLLVDRKAFLIGETEKSYVSLSQFLGYEPKIEFEKGHFSIKIKGIGKVAKDDVIIKVGSEIVEKLHISTFVNKYDVLNVVTEEVQAPEVEASTELKK